MYYKKYISINSKKRFGRPCIKDTRISVYDILTWLANGQNMEEIIKDFPELNKTKIKAALAFAASKKNKSRVA